MIPSESRHFLRRDGSRSRRPMRRGGFSVSELVVTIAILSILATIALVQMSGSFLASKETLTLHRVELLNRALYQFSQQNYEMVFTARDDSGADEIFVLRTVQYRHPEESKAKLGAPYVTPVYNPTTSSDPDDYRIRWTGKLYEMLRPGESGLGIKMDFDGADMTTAFQFPPNFQMAGR